MPFARSIFALSLAFASAAVCLVAHADPLPLERAVKIGRPARDVRLSLAAGDDLLLSIAGKRVNIPARKPTEASIEVVQIDAQSAIAVVRAKAENGEWAAIVGGRSGTDLLLAERTDAAGDPGERRALAIDLGRADASPRTVSVGTKYEALSLCSERPVLVARRVVEPKTLTLVAAAFESPGKLEAISEASVAVSSASGPPALPALTAVGSSEVDPDTRLTVSPRALVDGSTETAWTGRQGAFALLRARAPATGIERLELTFSAEPGAQRPTELLILGDKDSALHVRLPTESAANAVAITPPSPLQGSCLALVIAGAGDAQKPVFIAELSAYTELDRGDGVERLIARLVQDADAAAEAADLLASLGPAAAKAVALRFDELSDRGKRRALRIVGRQLALDECRARVVQAARSDDAGLSEAALSLLETAGPVGQPALRELALEPGAAGDRAAKGLATRDDEAASLLLALGKPGGADRPLLRRALMTIAKRNPTAFRAAVDVWLGLAPSVAARAALALLSASAGQPELALALAETNLPQALRFEDRYRFALAVAHAAPSDEVDDWLATQCDRAPEWMMRRAAFESLSARNQARAHALAPKLATDPYPRVRAAALSQLAPGAGRARAEEIARSDRWPMVRTAAVRALTPFPESRPVFEASLEDTSRFVRTAAIDGLASQGHRSAWPLVTERLEAPREWPEVQAAAIRFAQKLCIAEAREPLLNLLRRSVRPDANDEDAALGLEALRALHDLGGVAGRDAELVATRDSAPAGLQKALAGLPPPACAQSK